jgi:serine/threonine-protein kinase
LNVLLYILLAAVLLGGAYLGIRALMDDAARSDLKLLDFVGQDIGVAGQQLDKAGIAYTTQEISSDTDKGIILKQDPKAGETLPPGGALLLTVSSGRQQAQVPDVTGMNYLDAEVHIKNSGFTVGDERPEDSDKPKDTVVRQEPAGLTYLDIGGKVDIWISRPSDTSAGQIPNVLGLLKDDAVKRLTDRNIDSANIKITLGPSNFAAGYVDSQLPVAGTAIDNGTMVDLHVSNGVPPGYPVTYIYDFTVTADNTTVTMSVLDENGEQKVYENIYNAGTYEKPISFNVFSLGQKTLIFYYNGKEVGRKVVTFDPSGTTQS